MKFLKILKKFSRPALAALLWTLAAGPAKGESGHRPRLLVGYSEAGFGKALASRASEAGEARFLSSSPVEILELDPDEDPEAAAARLRQSPGVLFVEVDEEVEIHAEPNDPDFELQWQFSSGWIELDAARAWDHVTSAPDLTVAVVDSGCDAAHPDLTPNLWENLEEIPDNGRDDDGNGYVDDMRGWDFVNGDTDPDDDNGHGTMVFGILAASGNNRLGVTGVVWKARVMCLKNLGPDGRGRLSDSIAAIDYAVAHGAAILNLSWGFLREGAPSLALAATLTRAEEAGVLVVASAGNDGVENNPDGGIATYPASYPNANILAVASTDRDDVLSPFSNYGAKSVDLAAPGEALLTTYPGGKYQYFTGTSASAPLVAGAAALLWTQQPGLEVWEVAEALVAGVDPVPSLAGKMRSGGRIDLARPLGISSTDPQNPRETPGGDTPPYLVSENGGGCVLQAASPLVRSNDRGAASLFLIAGMAALWTTARAREP